MREEAARRAVRMDAMTALLPWQEDCQSWHGREIAGTDSDVRGGDCGPAGRDLCRRDPDWFGVAQSLMCDLQRLGSGARALIMRSLPSFEIS